MRWSASKSVVGVDIEPGNVAVVQARPGTVAVERAACARLAPDVVRDGEVADVDALAETLKELFAEHKLGRRVRVGLANQRIVMRTVEFPPLKDAKQLASAVRFQAQDHIPMPLDQAILEHHSLGLVETPDGPRTRVVLVAARRDVVERLLEALRRAGLRPHGVDLAAFAMIRALHQPGRAGPTLYLSVGGMTNLALALDSVCVFTRTMPMGLEAMAGQLAERQGLTLEHAQGWLRHVGLSEPLEQVEGEPAILADARRVLEEGARRVGDEVRTTIDFHRSQSGLPPMASAVLTGPAVAVPGFCEALGSELGLPLEVGLVSEARPGAIASHEAGRLAVAAGLTTEEVAA